MFLYENNLFFLLGCAVRLCVCTCVCVAVKPRATPPLWVVTAGRPAGLTVCADRATALQVSRIKGVWT